MNCIGPLSANVDVHIGKTAWLPDIRCPFRELNSAPSGCGRRFAVIASPCANESCFSRSASSSRRVPLAATGYALGMWNSIVEIWISRPGSQDLTKVHVELPTASYVTVFRCSMLDTAPGQAAQPEVHSELGDPSGPRDRGLQEQNVGPVSGRRRRRLATAARVHPRRRGVGPAGEAERMAAAVDRRNSADPALDRRLRNRAMAQPAYMYRPPVRAYVVAVAVAV